MAMCKVLSHHGGGLYSVEVYMDDSNIATKITELDTEIIRLTMQITDFQPALQAAEADKQWYIERNNTLIADLYATLSGTPQWHAIRKDIQKTTENGLKSRNNYIITKSLYNQFIADKTALSIERTRLNNIPALQNPVIDVWCIDLADGINGRAIYAANEESELWCLQYNAGDYVNAKYLLPPKNTALSLTPNAHFNIVKAYPSISDACMTFYNAALEPGFAKWQPLLVSGIVSGNSYNDCTILTTSFKVILDDNSRFQSASVIAVLPVTSNDYFDKQAIEEGDHVVCTLVRPDNSTPVLKIIGYYDNPKISNITAFTVPLNYTESMISYQLIDITRTYTVSGAGVIGKLIEFGGDGVVGTRIVKASGLSYTDVTLDTNNDPHQVEAHDSEQTFVFDCILDTDGTTVIVGSCECSEFSSSSRLWGLDGTEFFVEGYQPPWTETFDVGATQSVFTNRYWAKQQKSDGSYAQKTTMNGHVHFVRNSAYPAALEAFDEFGNTSVVISGSLESYCDNTQDNVFGSGVQDLQYIGLGGNPTLSGGVIMPTGLRIYSSTLVAGAPYDLY